MSSKTNAPGCLVHRPVRSITEAAAIIRELLKHAPIPHCADMHHSKKDTHEWDQPCPVVARAMKIRNRAEAFISANVPDEVSLPASGTQACSAGDVPEVPKAQGLTPSAR